jgi:hypothetical protein
MSESADEIASKAIVRKGVRVRAPLRAPSISYAAFCIFYGGNWGVAGIRAGRIGESAGGEHTFDPPLHCTPVLTLAHCAAKRGY